MKNVVFIVDITLKGSQRDVGRWVRREVIHMFFVPKLGRSGVIRTIVNYLC